MKKLILILALLVCAPCFGQTFLNHANFKYGNGFFEPFGNASAVPVPCFINPSTRVTTSSGCGNIWEVEGGTANSITACPAGFNRPATVGGYAGANCLKMLKPGSDNSYIVAYGGFQPVPASAVTDEYLTFYVTSQSLSASETQPFFCISTDNLCGTYSAKVYWHLGSGLFNLEATNGTTQTSVTNTITLNAPHVVHLHQDSVLANCTLSLDGVATSTGFSCGSGSVARATLYRIIGNRNGGTGAITYYVGSWYAVNSSGYGYPPSILIDYRGSGSSSGDTLSTINLNASSFGTLTGAWTCGSGTGPASALTLSSTANYGYGGTVDILGTHHLASETTFGENINLPALTGSPSSAQCNYSISTPSPTVSEFYWASNSTPTNLSSYHSVRNLSTLGDFASTMWGANGKLYLESASQPNNTPDIGSWLTWTPSTEYGFGLQLREYDITATPGRVYIARGYWGVATPTCGETMNQASSGAVALFVCDSVNGAPAYSNYVLTQVAVSGQSATYSYSSYTGAAFVVGQNVATTGFAASSGANNTGPWANSGSTSAGAIVSNTGGASGSFVLATTTQVNETHAGVAYNAVAAQLTMVSGAPDGTNVWTGATSGATFTPKSVPTSFSTLAIYNVGCGIPISLQYKLARSTTPSTPNTFGDGSGGDSYSVSDGQWKGGPVILDILSGRMVPCQ